MASQFLLNVNGFHEMLHLTRSWDKVGQQHLRGRCLLLIKAVVLLDFSLLMGEEMEGLTGVQLVHRLRIETRVVDGGIGVNDARHLYTQVATCAVAVGQWLRVVRRSDE